MHALLCQGTLGVLLCLLLCAIIISNYSADPLSNISGMLTFDSSEEAIAFAVKNGTYIITILAQTSVL